MKADEKQVEKEAPSLFTKPPVTTSLFGATPQGSLFTAQPPPGSLFTSPLPKPIEKAPIVELSK